MNQQQELAIRCAVADLIGALQVHKANDPFVQLDEAAVRQTLHDLEAAFPTLDLEIPEELQ